MWSELLGPSTWLSAVRCTSHSAPCHATRSVFSLWRQMPARQSWLLVVSPETRIFVSESHACWYSAAAAAPPAPPAPPELEVPGLDVVAETCPLPQLQPLALGTSARRRRAAASGQEGMGGG